MTTGNVSESEGHTATNIQHNPEYCLAFVQTLDLAPLTSSNKKIDYTCIQNNLFASSNRNGSAKGLLNRWLHLALKQITNKQTNKQISQAFTDVSFWTPCRGLQP